MRLRGRTCGRRRRCSLLAAAPAGAALQAGTTVGPVTNVSASCAGQNAEVEQAADAKLGYVYEIWMGCRGIALARSTDGGQTFGTPISLPGSLGSNLNTWDPAVTVAPDGTVYAVFMIARGQPVVPGRRRVVRPRADVPAVDRA